MSVVYAIQNDGTLLQYKHFGSTDGSGSWDIPKLVGTGWQNFKGVFSTKENVVYAIQYDGTLLWYKHLGQSNGSSSWEGPKQVGTGWQNFKSVFSGGSGVIYAIQNDGTLLWYKHLGQSNGSSSWEGPKQVGTGWQNFKSVFSGGSGVIYAIQNDGTLLWYKHLGQSDGSSSWEGSKQVGTGWQSFREVLLREDNTIYAIQNDGTLLWYKHLGQSDGSSSWEGSKQVGTGWNTFLHVFGGVTEEIGLNFTFDPGITNAQIRVLLERHRFAFSRIMGCNNLNNSQRQALIQAYQRPIQHGINITPGVNASAIVGGNQIWVNFGVLFPQGDNEIAQTLIHEMMHCAGFTHPNRTNTDQPFDNGPYYSTPPLQSEICIAGNQSDLFMVTEKLTHDNCVVDDDGKYTIYRD